MGRRLISSSISQSTRWNKLSGDFERLFYILMIAHADAFGRGDGDIEGLKMRLIPAYTVPHSLIQCAIVQMQELEMINHYNVDGKFYYEILNWEKFQNFNDKNRRYKSKIPDCPPEMHSAALFKTVPHCDKVEGRMSKVEGLKPKEEKNFLFGIEHSERADKLISCIKNRDPKFKITENQRNQWADQVRLIQTADGRTLDEIDNVLEFSQNDEFWSKNILSMGKLRKQFSQLLMKSQSRGKKRPTDHRAEPPVLIPARVARIHHAQPRPTDALPTDVAMKIIEEMREKT